VVQGQLFIFLDAVSHKKVHADVEECAIISPCGGDLPIMNGGGLVWLFIVCVDVAEIVCGDDVSRVCCLLIEEQRAEGTLLYATCARLYKLRGEGLG